MGGGYQYDAHRRRTVKFHNGETIFSVYGLDGSLLYGDNASTGETTDYIAMGGHSVGRFDAAGAFTWVHSDHLGGAAAASDANGHLIWTESYT